MWPDLAQGRDFLMEGDGLVIWKKRSTRGLCDRIAESFDQLGLTAVAARRRRDTQASSVGLERQESFECSAPHEGPPL